MVIFFSLYKNMLAFIIFNRIITICNMFVYIIPFRWLKFEEDVEDGGDRWSKPYVATLSLHSLFELRSCILNGTVMLDMRASTLDEIAGDSKVTSLYLNCSEVEINKEYKVEF